MVNCHLTLSPSKDGRSGVTMVGAGAGCVVLGPVVAAAAPASVDGGFGGLGEGIGGGAGVGVTSSGACTWPILTASCWQIMHQVGRHGVLL